ncbi:pimeloyl-ACP methyl ester carboxylesterase [Agromyces terreus]|uniref:Pimeloyl-ACP methyl ester carboxylesterase n=1 Tax=Agromyces terreus TaxID=424795 RepID=A0A9X2H5M4_9MICO|nr:alpha/beta hydrolase [Agromyces terreus]MCP2369839.1 pimeloyl-ACP methyl ester carboxylesterase [Agromyces terreus]
MTTVLLHGLGADRRQPLTLLEPMLREVSGEDELIIAPDVRAHGGFLDVGHADDFAIDALAAEVAGAVRRGIDEAGGSHEQPVSIFGISMGAALALRITLDELLPVERAVFIRPSFDDKPLPENLRAFPVIGQVLADAGPSGAAEFQERELYHRVAEVSPIGARSLLAQFSAPDAARRAMRLVEIPRNRAFRDDAELAELETRGIRSLVVGALRDPVHPMTTAERWAAGTASPMLVLPARDDGPAAQAHVLTEQVARWMTNF